MQAQGCTIPTRARWCTVNVGGGNSGGGRASGDADCEAGQLRADSEWNSAQQAGSKFYICRYDLKQRV